MLSKTKLKKPRLNSVAFLLKESPITASINDNQYTVIARLGKSHGLRGFMRLQSFTTETASAIDYAARWQLQNPATKQLQTIQLEQSTQQAHQLLVKIEGCDSPEAAKQYANWLIVIPTDSLPEAGEDEHYWDQLVGMAVYNTEKVHFGQVESVFNNGAHDILTINGEQQRLIPYTKDAIKEVKLEQKIIIVDWDEDF